MKMNVFSLLMKALSDDPAVVRGAKFTVVKNLELIPDQDGDYLDSFIAYIAVECKVSIEEAKELIRDSQDMNGLAMILAS